MKLFIEKNTIVYYFSTRVGTDIVYTPRKGEHFLIKRHASQKSNGLSRYFGAQTKRPKDKTSQDKTSSDIRSYGQNVPRDKTSSSAETLRTHTNFLLDLLSDRTQAFQGTVIKNNLWILIDYSPYS